MTGYLTNTHLSDKARCEYAAKKSGFNVEFRDHPMPRDESDYDMRHYNPAGMHGVYGSVYTNEPYYKDHGPFWRAWDEFQQ